MKALKIRTINRLTTSMKTSSERARVLAVVAIVLGVWGYNNLQSSKIKEVPVYDCINPCKLMTLERCPLDETKYIVDVYYLLISISGQSKLCCTERYRSSLLLQ